MTEEYQPILLLPAQKTEYRSKGGGGAAKPPLVEVTDEFRGALDAQLSVSAKTLEGLQNEQKQSGVPLAIRLRAKAFAKSNRPFALLKRADAEPVAAGRVGELIARATPASLSRLQHDVRTRSSKADLFDISTFESVRLWDPIFDAFGVSTLEAAEEVLDAARTAGSPLRIDLFPWIHVDTPLNASMSIEQYLDSKGFKLVASVVRDSWTSAYFDLQSSARAEDLSSVFGIRSAGVSPTYSAYSDDIAAQWCRPFSSFGASELTFRAGSGAEVGLLDSGVSSDLIEPWIVAREQYDTGDELDTGHGTFVAGLLVASRELNSENTAFPDDTVGVVDAQVLPKAPIQEYMLIERIAEVLEKHAVSGPKVWNCSFASPNEMNPIAYSTFAQEMDRLASLHGILFVQAAGNYVETPIRTWPPTGQAFRDGLSSPADAVASLTVGSLSHLGGLTKAGCPASYSRRGPGFGGQHKPDVTYWSGDFDDSRALGGFGINSVGPGDEKSESVGTSFATPIVSSIAANIWKELDESGGFGEVRPELVKGLLIHAALVQGQDVEDAHRSYHGVGVPIGGLRALFDQEGTFTTVHEVDLQAGVDWRKDPFPVPQCLFSDDRLRGEMMMTVACVPLIDPAFGDEAIRTCVEGSLGVLVDMGGKMQFTGKVKAEDGAGACAWETERITQGKWSPIKTYRTKYSRGTQCGGDWALNLSMTVRDESLNDVEQKVFVIVTFRGLEDGMPVYQDGIRAVNSLRYQAKVLSNVAHLRVGS